MAGMIQLLRQSQKNYILATGTLIKKRNAHFALNVFEQIFCNTI